MNEQFIETIAQLTKAIAEKKENGASKEELENLLKTELEKLSAPKDTKTIDVDAEKFNFKSIMSVSSTDPMITKAQEANDRLLLLSTITGKDPKSLKYYQHFREVTKALYTSGTNAGAEYIPTGFSARLIDKVRAELQTAGLFITIPMPTNPYTSPVLLADSSAYYISESTADEITSPTAIKPSTPSTGNFTLTAKKFATKVVVSEEVTEDSIIPILPLVEKSMAIGLANALENAIINGDTGATPIDSDLTASYDPRKAFNGLRKLTVAGCKVDVGSATTPHAGFIAARATMGVYGLKPSELAVITSIKGYLSHFLGMTEVTTVDKYGANATILTGELGKIDGVPIIVSSSYKENLDATGVVPAGGGTKTAYSIVNKNAFAVGERANIKVNMADDVGNDQKIIVATMRRAFSPVFGNSTTAVAYGYNI